ncbi:MAG: hypothetical protein FJX76_14705 [Armatimonadetes bacterium]|nr:hypothetical protein [Armatimonadota bacterium]
MNVLGISCFYHDAAAALLVNGELVAAAEEERFSRVKHDYEFPQRAIDFCLKTAGITGRDLDLVVFYEKPFTKLDRILMSALQTFPRSLGAFREGMLVWLLDKLWVRDVLHERIGCDRKRIAFCAHHLSHAASAFYCSPFDAASVLTVDGVGEWATGTRGVAWDNRVELQDEMRYPHSVGLLYSAFTAFLGFQVNEGEYKVMGLAPYGEPRHVDLIFEKMVRLHDDGSFTLDMDYFAFQWSAEHSFSGKFCDVFGRPRKPEESNLLHSHYADIAASIQKATEEILVRQARALRRRSGHENLAMSGGVALNSVANARILRESGFSRLFIHPAAGDGGGALGAALWGHHMVLGQPRSPFRMKHCYWGEAHSDAAVADFLKSEGHAYTEIVDEDALCDGVAERVAAGQVVGWMQGRFEWGPRALGHRSILADPRDPSMKDVVNARIKFREPFRPFAPSVLADRVEGFFELPDAVNVDPARYMLLVVPVGEEARAKLGAITHVDGTARLQAVHAAESPLYYKVIDRFAQATGVPVVLNTSFNLRGEPIVNTPAEAYSTFARSDMDALVMGRFMVSRRAIGEGRLTPGAEWSHAPTRVDTVAQAPDEQPPVPPVGRKIRDAVGIALVVLACLAIGMEVLLRLFVPIPNLQVGGLYVEDAQGIHLRPGWRGRVHSAEFDAPIAINSVGLRDPAVGPVPGRKHVLALGDSFTFGCWSPQDRTWLSALGNALGPGVQVINGGQPNAGTDVAVDFLKRRGDEFAPDVVVLGFYNGNDFTDNFFGRAAYTVEGGYLVMKSGPQETLSGYNCVSGRGPAQMRVAAAWQPPGFIRRSYLYQFIRSRFASTPPDTLRLNDAPAWFLKAYTAEMETAVSRTNALLSELLEECRRRGARLVIVDMPSSLEVEDDRWAAWSAAHPELAGRFDRARPSTIIGEWAGRNKVPFLSLGPALEGRPGMYYQGDMHWTDLGHFQAGERVAEFLKKEGIVP